MSTAFSRDAFSADAFSVDEESTSTPIGRARIGMPIIVDEHERIGAHDLKTSQRRIGGAILS